MLTQIYSQLQSLRDDVASLVKTQALLLQAAGLELKKGTEMNTLIQELNTKVKANTDAVKSAEALISGLSTQLAAALQDLKDKGIAADDLATLQSMSDTLGATTSELAASVVANTPAAPPAPPPPVVVDPAPAAPAV